MGPEESKPDIEIQEEYMVLWKGIVEEVVAKFKAKIEFTMNKRDVPRVQLITPQSERIGYMDYRILNRNGLYIEDSFTETEYLMQGVYTALQAVLLLEYPHTRAILGHLGFENLRQFVHAKKIGKSWEDAMKETPAFKSHSKLGFSIIGGKDSKLICHRDDDITS